MLTGHQLRESWRAYLSSDEDRIGPWWLAYVWTFVFAVICALGFTVLNIAMNRGDAAAHLPNWLIWFQANMVISMTIALTIRLLFSASMKVIGRERVRGWSKGWQTLYYAAVPVIGVSVAWPLALLWAVGVDLRREFSLSQPGPVVASIALAVLITFMFFMFFTMKTSQIRAENRATEAQLRLLQAQIEPHFLFNTLANVVSLMQTDTPRAQAMLESFVDYLRASLGGFAHGSHTLGDEIDLVEAYMRIIKIRMEDRVHYTVDVPAALRGRKLPALTLQPLVENAIVHGIEPQIGGGTVRVSAGIDRGRLVLRVEDDGPGMPMAATAPRSSVSAALDATGKRSTGTALANIRERLRQAYGDAAALRIDGVAPHGVCAELSIPATT